MTTTTKPGWHEMRYLFVFGDSYSSIQYDPRKHPPSDKNPLGNPPYPGRTYSGGPNWVGYLVKEHIPSFLAHDFAIAGVFAHQMKYEIESQFLPYAGSRPDWAPWESDEALFVTWVGINDMGVGFDAQSQLSTLFKLQESLYKVDARHFLFFNVPPTDRSPAALEGFTPSLAPDSNDVGPGGHRRNERLNSNIVGWNTKLAEHVKTFKMKHPDITIGIYDAHALFTKVLDNPQEYGFQDAYSSGDSDKYIWKDQLHPTSAMHKVIAADVAKFLTEFEEIDK